MKALITGIEGFVGGYLAQHLKGLGHELWGTTRRTRPRGELLGTLGVSTVRCDICNPADVLEALTLAKPDEIYHLAGLAHVSRSWQDPQSFVQTNIAGTLNLLEAARKVVPRARILLISTGDVYG